MFRSISSLDGKTLEFPNRDALLLGLESEENRCLQLNVQTQVKVQQLDSQGTLLDQAEVNLPLEMGQNFQTLLADFGLEPESKKGLLGALKSNRTPAPTDKTTPAAADKPVSPRPKRERAKNSLLSALKGALLVLALVMSFLSLFVAGQVGKQVKALKANQAAPQKVTTTSNQSSDDHAIDVFSRYFLGSYFNQTNEISNYIAPDIDKDKLKTSVVTPTSVLLESIKQKKGTWTVTYVCGLKDAKDEVTTKRVTFKVKQDKSSDYGYQVDSAPKLTDYPK